MTIRKFIHYCPSCRAKNKIITRCKQCFKLCCNECSYNEGICIDCYIKEEKSLVKTYFDDKNKEMLNKGVAL